MYAIILTGGKQYRVEKDMRLTVEKVSAEVGEKVSFNALMYADDKQTLIGADAAKVKVETEVVEHGKGRKLTIFTYKAKKNIRKKQGHRQPFTPLKENSIPVG